MPGLTPELTPRPPLGRSRLCSWRGPSAVWASWLLRARGRCHRRAIASRSGDAPRPRSDKSLGQDARDLPVGAQRHAGGAVRLELHAEHLVQLDVVAVEAEPRARHVQAPDPGRALAYLLDRLVPVRVQVGAPGGQGLGVVLAQVLLVPDLEAGVGH